MEEEKVQADRRGGGRILRQAGVRHVPETERRPVRLEHPERDSGPRRGPGAGEAEPCRPRRPGGGAGAARRAAGSLPQTAAPTRRSWERGWRGQERP